MTDLPLYDALVVINPLRIARRFSLASNLYEKLENLNIPIITPDKTFFKDDLLLLEIQYILAEEELKEPVYKREDKAKRGEYVISAPKGYDVVVINEKRTLIPNEDAEMIKQIYELYLQGNEITTISQLLDMPYMFIYVVLHNETYAGSYKHRIWSHKEGKQGRKMKDRVIDEIKIENNHEAIISKENFYKVQKIMKDKYFGDKRTASKIAKTILIYKEDNNR